MVTDCSRIAADLPLTAAALGAAASSGLPHTTNHHLGASLPQTSGLWASAKGSRRHEADSDAFGREFIPNCHKN